MSRKNNIKRMRLLKAKKKERELEQESKQITNDASERLGQKILSQNIQVVRNNGPVKYSELLKKLVQPYLIDSTNYDEASILFHCGVLAWNLSVMKQTRSDEDFKKILEDCNKKIEEEFGTAFFLEELMLRKEQLFSHYRVLITGIEITENKNTFGISVAVNPI